ncbi:MAG: hypothetical protein AB9907_17700 [Flexilinea sp.]
MVSISKSKIKVTIFFAIFFSYFCFGFLFSILSNFKYRAASVSLLALPILLLYKVKINNVVRAFFLLGIVVCISGIYNNASLLDTILFSRSIILSFLIYFLVKINATPQFMVKVMKICVWIADMQLPIFLLQLRSYEFIPQRLRGNAIFIDYGSGTFNYKSDSGMCFFLILIVIFLLFDNNRNYIINHRLINALWLSLPVLFAHSEINKITLLFIWLVYIFISYKRLLLGFIVSSIVVFVLVLFSKNDLVYNELAKLTQPIQSGTNLQLYFSGGNSRKAALEYLFSEGFTWLGAGPGSFFDPITREEIRGNNGHFYAYFSEVGFLSLLLSYIVLFLIIFPIKNHTIYWNLTRILVYLEIVILSFTANVMNDFAIFLIFCIISETYLIPSKSRRISND